MLFLKKNVFKAVSFYPSFISPLEKSKRERSQADLELPVQLRVVLSAEVIEMHHYSQLTTSGMGNMKMQTQNSMHDE